MINAWLNTLAGVDCAGNSLIAKFGWLLVYMDFNTMHGKFAWMFSKRKKSSSLVSRFQMLLALWGIVVYVFCVTGFWLLASQVVEDNAQRKAQLWISKLDMLSAPIYSENSKEQFEKIRLYLGDFPEVSYVKLYGADGVKVLGQYKTEIFHDFSVPEFSASKFDNSRQEQLKSDRVKFFELESAFLIMRVLAPVTTVAMSAGSELDVDASQKKNEIVKVIGYIDLGLNFVDYRDQLIGYVLRGSLFITVLFLIAVAIGTRLIKTALRPLHELRDPLQRVASGETNAWINREGDEEIMAIGNALDTTIKAIHGRDAKLKRLADYDALTDLVNKHLFSRILELECQRVVAECDSSALFFIDLDQFKHVNDTLGHAAGDRLLVRVASVLKNTMHLDDVVARFGGDEFGVLVKSIDRVGAIDVAKLIVKTLYDFEFLDRGKVFNIYCSVGISMIDSDEFTAEQIFSHADMACYSAKSQGRNRFHVYMPDELIKDKVDIGWSHRIADALANDKFQLLFQPIVSFKGACQPSFEVLIRMIGDGGELIIPNSFISIAERFGLATEIDYWVIKHAMQALEISNNKGQRLRFFINLSGQLFTDPEFVQRVISILNSVNIDANQIVFELTERTAVGDINNACEKMTLLKNHGFEFAVDDFGSGFSSFTYLKHMPVKYVKIEGEFVERITFDEVDRAMVKSMVDIAKACKIEVIAEYVGDKEALELLKRYGVDYVQGFFIAEPKDQPVVTNLKSTLLDNVAIFAR